MKHGESGVLQVVDMTGENLLRTLEYAIPADNDIRGWFYYFSGLKMTYAPSASVILMMRFPGMAEGA